MRVTLLTTAEELEPLAASWNALAGGVPFRRHEWLTAWWRWYGQGCLLHTLCMWGEEGELVGVAPLYLESSPTHGKVLALLGTGEVCSDYLDILCRPERQAEVVGELADWLSANRTWDSLRLEGLNCQETSLARLVEELRPRGCLVHRRAGPNCWRLELPATWADYEAALSKSHRKQVRRLIERGLKCGRAVLQTVTQPSQLAHAQQILIDLHQRRRQTLGQPGCFSSARFRAFHEEAMQRLLLAGMLRLHWLELDGQVAAAEYHVADGGVIYGYQAGVAPELMDQEPGRLAAIATLKLAIEQGFQAFDFLRGDEPYKAHFRAQPRPTVQYRVAPRRAGAHLRHRAWNAVEMLKDKWRERREDAKRLTSSEMNLKSEI